MSLGAVPSALDASVLVLNKFYMAMHIIPVRRAFCLLFKDLAEVITLDDGRYNAYNFNSWREVSEARSAFRGPDDEFVRTVHFEIQVPRVIRLLAFDRLPKAKVKFNRRNFFARDGNRCQYCGKRFPGSERNLSLDHVLPRSRGGQATWENIVCACVRCNVRKGGRTPAEAGIRLIHEPARPRTEAPRSASSSLTASTRAGGPSSTTPTGRWN